MGASPSLSQEEAIYCPSLSYNQLIMALSQPSLNHARCLQKNTVKIDEPMKLTAHVSSFEMELSLSEGEGGAGAADLVQ